MKLPFEKTPHESYYQLVKKFKPICYVWLLGKLRENGKFKEKKEIFGHKS